jgi:NAD-dependent dihydropyrimidine dehydrogenase PreA subunit
MKRDHSRRRSGTQYIQLNTGNCKACWKCIEDCPKEVFGKIDFLGHRHAKMRNPDECTGCLKCVNICKFNAILPVLELSNEFSR